MSINYEEMLLIYMRFGNRFSKQESEVLLKNRAN